MPDTVDLRLFEGFAPGRALAFLRAQAQPTYLVGGSVRDLLLGRQTHDLDLTLQSGALALARRLADAVDGAFYPLDVDRDTARVVLSDPSGEVTCVDLAAWRAESLIGDLQLRDFTINALALDLHDEASSVIDVTGGLDDLARRLVRTASSRALADDPLRGLRAIRLTAELAPLGFRLETGTAEQVRRAAPRLADCAAERVRDELVRILDAQDPDSWLRLMGDIGQLAVVLPEADAIRGVHQSAPHHWDVFEHTVRVVEHVAWQKRWLCGQVSPEDWAGANLVQVLERYRPLLAVHFAAGAGSAVRNRGQMLLWAALCHDWGKPMTRQVDEAGVTHFIGHEQAGAALAVDALRRLRFSEAEIRRVGTIVAHHMRPLHLAAAGREPSRRSVFRYFRDLGDLGIDVALLSLADQQATVGPDLRADSWQALLAVVDSLLNGFFHSYHEVVAPAPLIDGNALMKTLGLPSGPTIGRLLAAVAEAQAAGDVQSREQALDYAAQIVAAQPDAGVLRNPQFKR